MNEYLTKRIYGGIVFALAFFGTTILAVAISGTIKTWTTGEVLKSSDLNTTITSLKTAIEGIPDWTKSGSNAYYTAGNVGIGTSSPVAPLHVVGSDDLNSTINFLVTGKSGGNGGIYFLIDQSTRMGSIASSGFNSGLKLRYNSGGTNLDGLTLTPGGLVGIGSASPTVALHIVGAACSTVASGLTACASDKRLKENVQPITKALETIIQLNPVSFTWNKISEKEFGYKNGQKDIGVIAQEVEKINPEWVRTTTQSDYKAVNDNFVKWYSVKAIQELALRLRSVNEQGEIVKREGEKTLSHLRVLQEDNKRLRETVDTLRASVETHSRASLRLEERLRAIENMQMAAQVRK